MGYIDVTYDDKETPLTEYPYKLCEYLTKRYGLISGMKVLDVGCGRGEFTQAFKKLDMVVSSLDRDKSEKHQFLDDINYCNIEKDKFPYPDNHFHVVFNKSVLEHLNDPELFMKECHRILKPGGRLITLVPDWQSQMKIYFDDYTHRQPYTKNSARDLFKIFNFANIETEKFYQLPILWKYKKLKLISKVLQIFVPVTLQPKNKFVRWSVELMVLATGIKL